MGIGNWVLRKGIWYIVVVIAALSITTFFDLTPQPIKDLIQWGNQNTIPLLIAVCFLAACFTYLKVKGKKKVVDA